MATKATKNAPAQPYQQLMVLFSSYVVALREQEFSEETQMRILARTGAALTKIYTTEVLSKPGKRQGVYRTASTPSTSKKIPADQRDKFTSEESKKLNHLNEQIASKLYTEGITTEQFMTSLIKEGRATLPNLKAGLVTLKLNFSSDDVDLLLRKFNSLLDNSNGGINFGEFSHLFPKRQLDHVEEEMREDTEPKDKEKAGERKEREQPKRALTLNPFPQTYLFKNDTDSETSKSGQEQDDDMSDADEEEREHTPPREIDEEV